MAIIRVMMKQGTNPIAHAQPVALANAPSNTISTAAGIATRAKKIAVNIRNTYAVSNSFNIILYSPISNLSLLFLNFHPSSY